MPAIGFFEPWFDLFYPTFTIAAVWMAAKGLTTAGMRSRLWWLGAGLTLGVGLFFSYCQLAALGILGCWALVEVRRRGAGSLRATLVAGLWTLAGLAIAWECVLATTGYDLVRQFPREVATTWSVGAWTGEAMPHYQRPYFTWLFANLMEFASFHGVPLSIGLAWAAWGGVRRLRAKQATTIDTLAVGLLAAVLMLDLTGATRSEVARLWMFFMPVGAVAALRSLPAGLGPRLAIFGATVLQGLIFKLALTTNNIVN